ncbi:MAG TPA: hypothetical protein PKA41_01785 [Verrucomicrobiota bacterium]|nr:hypothetical protein [Verrucomicrobiota bacterium]
MNVSNLPSRPTRTNNRHHARRLGWFIVAVLWLLWLGNPAAQCAEPQPNRRVAERYLIIVESSSAMRRAADNTRQIVRDLLVSGMHSQLGEGDTVGVWTFNEGLSTGQVPIQNWSAEHAMTIVTNVDTFLKGLRFEKEPVVANVIPALKTVVATSERITILLLMSGSAPIAGTPIDYQINNAFYQSGAELKKARKPFVIVFRAQRGKFVSAAITWSPWPVELPDFPPLPKPVERTAADRASKTNTPNPVKPLIVIGKKPETPPPAPTVTEKTVEMVTPAVGAAPVATIIPSAPPASPAVPAPATQPTPAVESSVAAALPAETTRTPVIAQPAAPVAPPSRQQTEPVASTKTDPAPATMTPQPAPAPVAPVPTPGPSAGTQPQHPGEPATSPATVAVAIETGDSAGRLYLFAGLGALVLGVALIVLLLRRQRTADGGSLITHSMDRDEK